MAGLNLAIPSGVFRIGKDLLGETVQFALRIGAFHIVRPRAVIAVTFWRISIRPAAQES
jgi:hypothetical protein